MLSKFKHRLALVAGAVALVAAPSAPGRRIGAGGRRCLPTSTRKHLMLKTLRQRLGLVIAALAMLAGATAITTGAVAPTAAPVVAPKAAAAYASNITMCWHSGFAKYKITFNNSLAPGTYHILVSNGSYGSWWLSDSLAQTWQNNLFFYDSNWVNGVTSYGAPGVSSIWRSSTYTGWC